MFKGFDSLHPLHFSTLQSERFTAAISAMAPFLFKPEDAGQLLDWFTLIVDPAGRMPFYFYDIPAMTGVTIDTHEFVRRPQETLPGFAGVKYSNQNVDR